MRKKACSGFALLNVLLGVSLLAGVIFLIMHAMSNYHAEQNSRAIGEELAPVISALLTVDNLSLKASNIYSLLSNTGLCGANAQPLLVNVIANGYIQSLQNSGFNLCSNNNIQIN
jgi:hypothetical protein